MEPKVITKDNFEDIVLNSELPVLIDFWASWCGPCRMLSPIVDQVAEEMQGKAVVGKINVDEEPDLASRYGGMSIPTLVVMKDGKVVTSSVGTKSKESILSMVQ